MYSEADDFDEKKGVYVRMLSALAEFHGHRAISGSKIALEIGGSGGLLAGIISQAGPKVVCSDITDVQVKYGGEFPRLLKEKFQRNGMDLDLGKIEFHTMDAQDLIYGNERFDFIFSLNALEHIPNPIQAIQEAGRVLKPGGLFYASFDPIWTADSGSHFMHYTREPWLHLLIDDNEYSEIMRAAGATESERGEYLSAMNRLPVSYYFSEISEMLGTIFSKWTFTHWSGCVSPEYVNHPNRIKAQMKTGLSKDELMIRGFQLCGRR